MFNYRVWRLRGGERKKEGRQCPWQRARGVGEGGREGKLLQGVTKDWKAGIQVRSGMKEKRTTIILGEDALDMSDELIMRTEIYFSLQKKTHKKLAAPRIHYLHSWLSCFNISSYFLYKQSCNIKGNRSNLGDSNKNLLSANRYYLFPVKVKKIIIKKF